VPGLLLLLRLLLSVRGRGVAAVLMVVVRTAVVVVVVVGVVVVRPGGVFVGDGQGRREVVEGRAGGRGRGRRWAGSWHAHRRRLGGGLLLLLLLLQGGGCRCVCVVLHNLVIPTPLFTLLYCRNNECP
jgi:hypothetical protein